MSDCGIGAMGYGDASLRQADKSLLPAAGRVVVGFSGGADSTALAHWLLGLAGPGRVLLAHVNHGLRGAESDRDEAHARTFAQEMGVEIAVHRADVASLAKEQGLGLEECGRRVRYAFFDSLAPGETDCVCTAHTADDNAETLLLHLCRGAGLGGLCGIPPKRGKVVRPFLRVSRQEVEDYCARQGLRYVTDSTNFSLDYARNRVRSQVVPVLKELNPRFLGAAGQAMEMLSADRDFLEGEAARLLESAQKPFGLSCAVLLRAPGCLRDRALRQYLTQAGCVDLERRHIDLAVGLLEEGGGLSLPGGVQAMCALGLFAAWRAGAVGEPFSCPVSLGETPLPDGKRLILRKISPFTGQNTGKIQNLLFKNGLDYDTIYRDGQQPPVLTARTRRPGDRFTPAGGRGPRPMKELFREAGVPAWARQGLVLLEWEGRLVYCHGLGPAEGFQAMEGTRGVLAVEVEGL